MKRYEHIDDITTIPPKEFTHGRECSCVITKKSAVYQINDAKISGDRCVSHIAQNVTSGCDFGDKLGYKHSWRIRNNASWESDTYKISNFSFIYSSPTKTMGNLLTDLKSLCRKEPQKTRFELGIIDDKDLLTQEGKDYMLQHLYDTMDEKAQEEFDAPLKELVDSRKKEEKK